jgi:hypothetical protein
MIPIPPIQCVRLLQNRIDFGRDSMSVRIDAPVVVKPETDSKKALKNEGIEREMRYGADPIRHIRSQDSVTVRLASFWLKLL